jgi:hypothetical protein
MIKHKKFKREDLVKYLPSESVAEVGVALGEFSEAILKNNNPKKLFLIDAWKNFDLGYPDGNMKGDKEQEQRYNFVVNRFKNKNNVTIIREKSLDALIHIEDNSLDWVYIDADHSYEGCLKDLKSYDKKVKTTGYICGHDWLADDFFREGFGVNNAVLDFVKENDYILTILTKEKKYKSYVISKTLKSSEELLKKINEK